MRYVGRLSFEEPGTESSDSYPGRHQSEMEEEVDNRGFPYR